MKLLYVFKERAPIFIDVAAEVRPIHQKKMRTK